MKINEIKEQIKNLTGEVRSLIDAKDIDGAKAKREELRAAKEMLKIEEELAEEEMRDLKSQSIEGGKKMNKVNEMRAITKCVLGKELEAEERAVVISTGNGAVLPKEFVNELIELKKGYGSLKDYCQVIQVNKNEGTIPVVDYDQNKLADIAEGQDIVDGTLVTTDVPFKCSKVGLIQTLSSELVEDAEVEIEGLARNNFAEIAVAKENAKILKVIDTNATVVEGADYTALEDIMAKQLPSVKAGLVTITNVEGYAHLKNMKDKQGRNLGLITTGADGKEYFNGKEIITVDSSLITLSKEKAKVFYSLNFREAVKFIERTGIDIAKSTEAGFNNDTIKLRILERLDVVKGSARSIKKLELA